MKQLIIPSLLLLFVTHLASQSNIAFLELLDRPVPSQLDGLLGAPLLQSWAISINLPKQKFYIWEKK